MEYRVPYTPQQNGIIERNNSSITETALCMSEQFGMPHFLWEESYHNAIHILNRCPHTSVRDVTLEDTFLE